MENKYKIVGYVLGAIIVSIIAAGNLLGSFSEISNFPKKSFGLGVTTDEKKSEDIFASSYALLPFVHLDECQEIVKEVLNENKFEIKLFERETRRFKFYEVDKMLSEVRCVGDKYSNSTYAFIFSIKNDLHLKFKSKLDLVRRNNTPSNYNFQKPTFHNATYAIAFVKNKLEHSDQLRLIEEYFVKLGYKKDYCEESKCLVYRDGLRISFFNVPELGDFSDEENIGLIVNVTGGYWRDSYAMTTEDIDLLFEKMPNYADKMRLAWDWK